MVFATVERILRDPLCMLLAIDIGNTNIVGGVFAGDLLARPPWRIATETHRMPDEYGVLFTGLFQAANLGMSEVDGVILCSVVPPVRAAMSEAIRRYWYREPMVVSLQLDLGITVRYSPPQGVGADRIANAVAAVRHYGTPAIVVDFGTGTNFDAIASDGAYVGGAIAPGLEIAEDALYAHAAQLTRVPLVAPPSPIGTDTATSLQSGLLYGYAGLVDGLVERMRHELGEDSKVIATGGLAELVAPHTRTVQHVNPDLTLIGLRIIYQRNESRVGSARLRQDQPFP